MKVLWFSGVAPRKARVRQGMHIAEGPASWQEALLHAMSRVDSVRIGVAAPIEGAGSSFEEDNVTYYCLPHNVSKQKIIRGLRSWAGYDDESHQIAAALQAVDAFTPDLIHVHGTENPFGLLRRTTDIPIVISLQGLLIPYSRAFYRGLKAADIARLLLSKYFVKGSGEIHGYRRMCRYAKREREIMMINNSFIGRTEWDLAFQKVFSPQAKYFHCDEVIRPVFYQKKWQWEQSRAVTIFSTSSAMIFKGTETLLEAIRLLRKMGYSDIKARIAGVPYEGEVYAFYRRKAKQYDVEDAITWLGRLNAEQLLNELLQTSLFVYPTHIDNSPNSLVEAMLVGVPSVATFVGGIPSLMRNEIEGWLVPDSDAFSLAGKIAFALEHPDLCIKMGQNARARSTERNDPTAIAGKMAEIYKQIAGHYGC
jgi:glycosyltransferase involved in cell wall biosynthesis